MPTVRYFFRESEDIYSPFATSKREVKSEIDYRGGDVLWCSECQAVVEPVCKLDVTGLVDVCPFDGSELAEHA